MRLALAYSTKDQVGLSRKTFPALTGVKCSWTCDPGFDVHWVDGSNTGEGITLWKEYAPHFKLHVFRHHPDIRGGADAAIAYKLSALLSDPGYTHVGLIENDVLLDEGWYAPTMALFEQGARDGLDVGAVSARSYVDRVLIQRDDYAVMNNIGAGFIIFTREAAEIVLKSFRTGWYPENRWLFAHLAGIDLSNWTGFREHVTTDWTWEAQLARYGLASLALTPSKAKMPWEDESASPVLVLTKGPVERQRDEAAFARYAENLRQLRKGVYKIDTPAIIRTMGDGMLFHPHQLGYLAGGPAWQGTLELKWSQGFGPFAYRAGPGGASLSVHISGSALFLVSGGASGARVSLTDTRSGFNFAPDLPPEHPIVELTVPGGPVRRIIELKLSEGAVFYGIQTADPQMLDTEFRFNWSQLPSAT